VSLNLAHGEVYSIQHYVLKDRLKIPKGLSETINRRTENTMAKIKGQKDKQRSTKLYIEN